MQGPAPALLALDTSTETMAIAVLGPGGARHWCGPGGAQASACLLPQAQALLAELGLAWRDLDAVAFGAGPGAFTGLRTACAVAQGLGLGLGCPLLPIDSLAIVAEDAAPAARVDPDAPALWVAMDARMDEVYAGAYRPGADGWVASRAPALYTLAALREAWLAAPPKRVAGSALGVFGARLPTGDAERCETETDRAAALLRLARQAWSRGAGIDAAAAAPVYLRDKVAQTTQERALAKAASRA